MEKRNHLLKLIFEMKLPFTEKEAEDTVKNLSDEEVELLISTYKDISNFQNAVSESVRATDPSSYEKLQEDHDEKATEAEDKYLNEMEKLQEAKDSQLDSLENETTLKIDEAVKNSEQDIDSLEEAHEDLYFRIDQITPPN